MPVQYNCSSFTAGADQFSATQKSASAVLGCALKGKSTGAQRSASGVHTMKCSAHYSAWSVSGTQTLPQHEQHALHCSVLHNFLPSLFQPPTAALVTPYQEAVNLGNSTIL